MTLPIRLTLVGTICLLIAACGSRHVVLPPDGSGLDAAVGDAASGDVVRADLARPDGPTPDAPPLDAAVMPDSDAASTTWIPIKAGSFKMGSPLTESCRSWGPHHAETQHTVTFTSPIELAATEVTQGEFLALMGYNPAKHTSCGSDCPVEQVSWHEAAAYCVALSKQQGLQACYACKGSKAKTSCSSAVAEITKCAGFRLPTEAEWEHAYRAGSTSAFYSGAVKSCEGSDAAAGVIAWYKSNSGGKTHPVGQRQPNAWGLYDMAGNVAEWCHDYYQLDLGANPATDPVGPAAGGHRMTRGGSWEATPRLLRAAKRSPQYYPDRYTGFRCARTVAP